MGSKSKKTCKPGKCKREQPDGKNRKKSSRCKPGKCLRQKKK